MTKGEIRSYIKGLRNELPVTLRNEYNRQIQEHLYALKDFKESDMLFTYLSFGSEVDTTAIINKAFEMNKQVYIPKVEDNDMNFYLIPSLDGLIKSKFGVLEPDSSIHQRYVSSLSGNNLSAKKLMLIPGLAFDKSGNRVGYGAGYYDRFLGRHSQTEWIKIALAYEFQIMEQLTTNKFDIPTESVVSSEGVIKCKKY